MSVFALIALTAAVASGSPASEEASAVVFPRSLGLPLLNNARLLDDCDLIEPSDLGLRDSVCLRVDPAAVEATVSAYGSAVAAKGFPYDGEQLGAKWFVRRNAGNGCDAMAINSRADGQIMLWLYGKTACYSPFAVNRPEVGS